MTEQKKGTLIVLSGPSGVGKSTVIEKLLAQRQDIHFSVSYTTRQPRPGDVEGKTYHFVDWAEFERMIRDNELLEHAVFDGNYYGTSLKILREHLDRGTDVLLDIEVQGAATVREKCPDAVLVFIYPPSMEVLERRLRQRGTNTEESIAARLERARQECLEAKGYHYIVVNHENESQRTAEDVLGILGTVPFKVENQGELIARITGEN